ncbi:hypothetical protein pb186bvf_016176 [Paramecium bursaria]
MNQNMKKNVLEYKQGYGVNLHKTYLFLCFIKLIIQLMYNFQIQRLVRAIGTNQEKAKIHIYQTKNQKIFKVVLQQYHEFKIDAQKQYTQVQTCEGVRIEQPQNGYSMKKEETS